jgi:DNA-binding IclR family transcriptional regulator
MDRRKQTIEEFVKGTDFMPKLRAALENIEQGKGYAVFEGLQKKGTCTVAITFDGRDSLSLAAVNISTVRPEVRAKTEAPKTQENKPERSTKK